LLDGDRQMSEHQIEDSDSLVKLCSFPTLSQAMLVKGLLDSAGIECQLVDENMGRMFIAEVIGGVAIQVYRGDEEAAAALIGDSATKTDLSCEVEQQFGCPQCESHDVRFSKLGRLVEIPGVGSVQRKVWECKSCGYRWED